MLSRAPTQDAEGASGIPASLKSIADLTGYPVEFFSSEAFAPNALEGAVDLFQLWVMIKSEEDRAHLLKLARELAKI